MPAPATTPTNGRQQAAGLYRRAADRLFSGDWEAGSCIWREAPLAQAIQFLVVTMTLVLAAPLSVSAKDLTLFCPGDASEPQFKDEHTGAKFPISNPGLRALAEKACRPGFLSETTEQSSSSVEIENQTGQTIFVGFSAQSGSGITWGSGCTPISPNTAEIQAGVPCQATAIDALPNGPGSRFCATTTAPPGNSLDCWKAQANNETLIEVNFQPYSKTYNTCFNHLSCIWYDISLIPASCTDQTFVQNQCANTGGASYNFGAILSCPGQPTFTCGGPPFTTGPYAAAGYPSKCGNPNANYIDTDGNGVNAYWSPMSTFNPNHQPNAVCPNAQILTITFLSQE